MSELGDAPVSVTSLVLAALDSVKGRLREFDRANAQSFIDHGEAVIGLELICDQLYEYDVAVPSAARDLIRSASEAAHLDPAGWAMLRIDDSPADSHGQIVYLARAYFRKRHQLEGQSPEEVLRRFRESEAPADIEQLRGELRSALASHRSEDQLASLWLETAEGSYDPRNDGMTMTEWLTEVLEVLS
ncbi:contact-dependent growth inhibition system immunity protein [Agromyces larvae]|uniref:Contact-dependent growth inhibition system immunity protein n=1 Tax=Agromyces larvae TaxID=2929802 RepID=A0ABY4BUM9_9MICO|nr:contact-dependent growth inhibition system immunity protein [Agromyces larvae]UOE42855.1 contact-dependent growth inhibition system immunity protein [Agromyces larvae]